MHTYIQTRTHTLTRMRIYKLTLARMHTYASTRMHTHASTHTCTYARTHKYTQAHTHTHTHTHTSIHTHVHTNTRTTHTHTHMPLHAQDDISTIATVDAAPGERAMLAMAMRTRSARGRRHSDVAAAACGGRRAWSAHAGHAAAHATPDTVKSGKLAWALPQQGSASGDRPADMEPVGALEGGDMAQCGMGCAASAGGSEMTGGTAVGWVDPDTEVEAGRRRAAAAMGAGTAAAAAGAGLGAGAGVGGLAARPMSGRPPSGRRPPSSCLARASSDSPGAWACVSVAWSKDSVRVTA